MQIHELTTGSKKNPIAEGLWDTLKTTAAWKPGETFAQAKARVRNDSAVASIAKKAQSAWQAYEQQLQQYVAKLPPPQQAKTPPTTTPQGVAPGRRIQVPYQAPGQTTPSYYYKTSAGWTNELGQAVTDPKSIQGLEAAATKTGREQPDPNYVAPQDTTKKTTKKSSRSIKTVAEQVAPGSALDAYQKRTDGRYEQALKAFVQKNLLSGMPYSRLANAAEIDQIIKTMSQPQNADPGKQQPLWQTLALAAAVAQTMPQSAGGLAPNSAADGGQQTGQDQSAQELVEPIKQGLVKNQISPDTLTKAGEIIIRDYANGERTIRSTGNPNVDALLLNMGFKI